MEAGGAGKRSRRVQRDDITNVHHQEQHRKALNPSVYSFVRDCPAILAASAQSVGDQCSNRAPFLLPA